MKTMKIMGMRVYGTIRVLFNKTLSYYLFQVSNDGCTI